jgi:hypothetical protein
MTEQDTHTAALELRVAQLQRRCVEQAAEIRRLEGERDSLLSALHAYGAHTPECAERLGLGGCNCGLGRVLEK